MKKNLLTLLAVIGLCSYNNAPESISVPFDSIKDHYQGREAVRRSPPGHQSSEIKLKKSGSTAGFTLPCISRTNLLISDLEQFRQESFFVQREGIFALGNRVFLDFPGKNELEIDLLWNPVAVGPI